MAQVAERLPNMSLKQKRKKEKNLMLIAFIEISSLQSKLQIEFIHQKKKIPTKLTIISRKKCFQILDLN
jgi:hypothetical protein